MFDCWHQHRRTLRRCRRLLDIPLLRVRHWSPNE